MKRIMIACLAVAAFAAPALAGGAPTAGEPGFYGQVRSWDAYAAFNPNTTSTVANIGAIFSDRGASNSADNILSLNSMNGMDITATPPAPVCFFGC